MILPILILSFSFLILSASGGSEAPDHADPSMMVKAHCPSMCGNVSIPYPFGIGKECYHDEWFAITCNNHTNKPFLSKFNMEVVSIDYRPAGITVMNPVASNCDGRQQRKGNTVWSSIDFSGSPFTFSFYNYFVKSGCDRALLINRDENITIGCESICKQNESTCVNDRLYNAYSLISYNISIEESTTRNCTYAFLMSNSNYYYEPRESTFASYTKQGPVDISWVLKILHSHNHYCDDYGCKCPYAHTGNPYLTDGCTIVKACAKCEIRHCYQENSEDFRCKHTREIILDRGRQYLENFQYGVQKPLLFVIFLHFGGGLFLLLSCAFCFRMYIVIKKRRIENLKKKFFIRNGGLLLKQHISSDEGSIKKTILFTSDELMNATDNFNENRILGQGGQGTVYKGMLTDGKITAIKKSKLIDESQLDQFINEVFILSQMNHRNIVNLLGCCLETEVPLLVYEFVVNGNLYDLIQNKSEDSPLSWKMRLQIATEVAGGLSYLHSASSVPIYHRDIKSTNILLDENYRAKISDFGTSRSIAIEQTHLTTLVYGTLGYLDPEYFQSSQFTDKSDVYSFGVVLAELLTGQKPISSLLELEEERSLATRFTLCTEEMRVFDMIDIRNLEDASKDEIVAVSQIATRCLNLNGKKRPTMKEVATDLQVISRVPSTIVPMSIEK